tara:strand:+ start:677 stop:1342 length:666 start_codon:yes stop_codon:yes gene_type:complete
MKKISAVINARKGSTRVENKLLRSFADSTLIEIALSKLNKMDFFDKRYLAVAEEEFKILLPSFPNVSLLPRDRKAVNKGVNPLTTTFAHYLNVESDYIFVFNPCLPFISIKTIKKVFDYFQKTDYKSYTAVIKTGDWIFDNKGNPLTNNDPKNATTNKNMTFYKACHAFHIVNKNRFKKDKVLWEFEIDDPHLFEIQEKEAIDIDTIQEFNLAELLYKKSN